MENSYIFTESDLAQYTGNVGHIFVECMCQQFNLTLTDEQRRELQERAQKASLLYVQSPITGLIQ